MWTIADRTRNAAGAALILLTALGLMLGCTAAQVMKDPPRVMLVSVDVGQSTVLEQRYLVTLRIQNHSPADLAVSGLAFDLYVNDKLFASGVSSDALTVKGFGEGEMKAKASSTALALYRQIMVLAGEDRSKLTYRLSGKLGLGGLSTLPFEKKGELALTPDKSGRMGLTALN